MQLLGTDKLGELLLLIGPVKAGSMMAASRDDSSYTTKQFSWSMLQMNDCTFIVAYSNM